MAEQGHAPQQSMGQEEQGQGDVQRAEKKSRKDEESVDSMEFGERASPTLRDELALLLFGLDAPPQDVER